MKFFLLFSVSAVMLCSLPEATIGQDISPKSKFQVKSDLALRQLNKNFCWFHPRAAAMPGFGKNGKPAVIIVNV